MNPLRLFKCLSDDTRLRCMLLIKDQNELCVCELTTALEQIQPKVSRNLAQLKNCGLLSSTKQGQWVFYRLNPDLDAWVIELLETTLSNSRSFMASSREKLEQMGDRPSRVAMCCAN